jgi:hypothetical protein
MNIKSSVLLQFCPETLTLSPCAVARITPRHPSLRPLTCFILKNLIYHPPLIISQYILFRLC